MADEIRVDGADFAQSRKAAERWTEKARKAWTERTNENQE